jgi:prepilin-type N-terminal cleavage/methylation domain-containing protein
MLRGLDDQRTSDSGYSLLEVLAVITVASIMYGLAAGYYPQAAAAIQGDANMRIVNWQLKLARETAINERRDVEVQFIQPNTIRLVRHNIPNGTTVLHTAVLENRTEFLLFPSQPDTPDGFGRTQAVWFGGAAAVMFTADGMLTDAAGNPVNGSIFLGQVAKPMTARALTVFGPTATLRSYRWNGTGWRR